MDRIGYHEVKTDASGRLVPWYGDDPKQAYDHVIRQVWNFWITMGNGPSGVPYYLQHQVWKPDRDDPRGLGGDQIYMALSSWNLLGGYLGDPAVRANQRLIADYWMDHGLSPEDQKWGGLPYPYNLGMQSGRYDGDMRAGAGFLQPDKAASFGAELVMMYKATGERRYLDRAVKIADCLARNVKPGDEANSPWPFRVNSATGEIPEERNDHDHLVYRACYTTNWTGALRLYDDLAALDEGHPQEYRRVSRLVTGWLKAYPLRNNRWGPFFEDVSTKDYSDTEINADTLAFYILEHPGWDPGWRMTVREDPELVLRHLRELRGRQVGRGGHQRADGLSGTRKQPHVAPRLGGACLRREGRGSSSPGSGAPQAGVGDPLGGISTGRTGIRATTSG